MNVLKRIDLNNPANDISNDISNNTIVNDEEEKSCVSCAEKTT